MITKEDVLKEVDREIESVKKRGWVKRHWPKHVQNDPPKKIIDDLLRQKEAIKKKDNNFFKDFDDIHDVLNDIEDEVYGSNN